MSSKEEFMPFTCSGGGPTIVLPIEVVGNYGSNSTNGEYGSHEDYDRACEPNDNIYTEYNGLGWIDVNGTTALVLASECHTQFLRTNETEGVFYRRGTHEVTENQIREELKLINDSDWISFPKEFTLTDGRFFAFDAAYQGFATIEKMSKYALPLNLQAGTYDVNYVEVDGVDFIKLKKKS